MTVTRSAMLNPPRGNHLEAFLKLLTAATFHLCMVFCVSEAMARPPLTQWTFIEIPLFPCARNNESLNSSGCKRHETREETSNCDWHTWRSTFQSLQMNVGVGACWNVSSDLLTRTTPQPHPDRYPPKSSIWHRQNPLARLHSRPDGSDPREKYHDQEN